MKLAVTGATGLVGGALCQDLIQAGHQMVALARNPEKAGKKLPAMEVAAWDAISGHPPVEALEGLNAVVHLAGEAIAAGRWTSQRKRMIRESRVVGTRNLVEGLSHCQNPPKVLVSSSAIGYYGTHGDELLEETSQPGNDFLAELCQEWESEAKRAADSGVRVVLVRSGLILAREGGALPRMLPPFKMGVGGPLASGKQWMSWIHIKDELEAIKFAIEQDTVEGPLNLTAPNPVTNEEFSKTLARVLRRRPFFGFPGSSCDCCWGRWQRVCFSRDSGCFPKNWSKAVFGVVFPI